MKHLKHVASATALGVGALLLAPEEGQGWNLLGHSLGTGERDARMFDNFSNNAANNNTTEEANFPGYTGAELAFWKGCVEWGSGPHGNGTSSDTTQSNIGDGGANFDTSWQGNATAVGGPSDNIASEISGSDGGTFAFAESSSAGWRIRFYSVWNWADGPGGIGGNQTDIQGIGCHEYGHALGMAHSGTGAATMAAGTFPGATNTRSIHADDSAGIQALYGTVNPNVKPLITNVSLVDDDVTITGQNFDATDLEIWFTQKGIGGSGTPVKVSGVTSSAGGTVIDVSIPLLGGKGDILVKNPGAPGNNLSNAWPFNGEGPDPTTPFVQLITPNQWPVISADNEKFITIQGASLSSVSSITVDGIPLSGFPPQWDIIDDNELTMSLPILEDLTELGTVDLVLTNSLGSTTVPVEIVAPSTPTLRLGEGNDPEGMNSFTPHVLRMAGQPGNVVFLWVSGSNLPTPVPGLFDLDIGNLATNLFYMGSFVIEPKGWVTAQYQFSGLPFLTTIYWQGVEYDVLSPTFPVPATNVSTGFWSF